MEEIIKTIQDLFEPYNSINFKIIDNKKIELPNKEDLNYEFHIKTHEIKKELERIYLLGNNISLERIKNRLIIIESTIKETNCRIEINLPKFNNKLFIKQEDIESINYIKLRYINDLNSYINGLINPIEFAERKEYEKKYKACYYALTYIFEMNARCEKIKLGNKKMLEAIGEEMNPYGSGNRFYKLVNDIINNDWVSSKERLDEYIGNDWEDVILKLTKHSELVKKYIKSIPYR